MYGPDVALAAALGSAVRLEASQTAPRIPCSRGGAWRCVRVVLTCHVHLGLGWSWHVLGPGLLNSPLWCSPVSWLVALPWLLSGWRMVLCEGGAHVPCSPGPLLVLARAWAGAAFSSSWCSPVSWLAALCTLAALLNSDSGICCCWPSSLHPPLDECSLGGPPAPEPGVPCWGRGPIRLHTHTHTLHTYVFYEDWS